MQEAHKIQRTSDLTLMIENAIPYTDK
jgi:hypothetical protein